jgi:hypothetical protein
MNQESHFEKKKYFTLISFAAFFIGIAAFLFSFISLWTHSLNWYLSPYDAQGPYPWILPISKYSFMIAFCGGFIGLMLSIVAAIDGLFKKPRTIKILVSILSFSLSFWAFLIPFRTHNKMCNSVEKYYVFHLQDFGRIIKRETKGQLPQATNWCETLIKLDPNSFPEIFINNPNLKISEGMSEYAFNTNVSGLKLAELQNNTVLFFETPLAQNPAGGPELMSTNNHPIKGCFVLFADMHIAFVRAEDFNNLRWKP